MKPELAELFENIIDDGGYAIGYWVSQGHHDAHAQTYRVTLLPEYVESWVSKTITYQDLYNACNLLATGEVSVNSNTKKVCQAIVTDPDDVDYDAEDADVIIQVALFGDIIFG